MGEGFLLVISGPSGVGKGTVSEELLKRNKDIIFSISATTRKPRPGEENGKNYFFYETDEFERMVDNNEFLEYANVHNNYYGTPRKFVMDEIEKGEIVLLEIDVQGAMQVKENYKNVVFIFLLPPTMDELRNRIEGRGTESKEDIERRLENAFKEIDFVGEYDYFVVNDEVEKTVEEIEAILISEKLRVKRHKNIKERVLGKK